MGCDPSIGIHDLPDCGAPCYNFSLVLHISKRLSPPRRSPPQTRTGGVLFRMNKILALKPHNWLLGLTNLQGNTKDAETEYAKLQSKPAGGFREPRFLGVEPCSENRTAFRFMCGARENHAE